VPQIDSKIYHNICAIRKQPQIQYQITASLCKDYTPVSTSVSPPERIRSTTCLCVEPSTFTPFL